MTYYYTVQNLRTWTVTRRATICWRYHDTIKIAHKFRKECITSFDIKHISTSLHTNQWVWGLYNLYMICVDINTTICYVHHPTHQQSCSNKISHFLSTYLNFGISHKSSMCVTRAKYTLRYSSEMVTPWVCASWYTRLFGSRTSSCMDPNSPTCVTIILKWGRRQGDDDLVAMCVMTSAFSSLIHRKWTLPSSMSSTRSLLMIVFIRCAMVNTVHCLCLHSRCRAAYSIIMSSACMPQKPDQSGVLCVCVCAGMLPVITTFKLQPPN